MLNELRDEIYADAVAHGLYDDADWGADEFGKRVNALGLISGETIEALQAANNTAHFYEEIADILIMTLSVCGKLGIDIDAEVQRKMSINKTRPWGHKGEKCNDA